MAIIRCNDRGFCGVRDGVGFTYGRAETNDPKKIEWFVQHGYHVDEPEEVVEEAKPVQKKKPFEHVNFETTQKVEQTQSNFVDEVVEVEEFVAEEAPKRKRKKETE